MPGLTPLGIVHTSISLIALAAGFACLLRDGRIAADNRLGSAYIWATVLTCITGFGIFAHGGFGKPHALGVLTLLVIGFAMWPGGASLFAARWRYVVTVSYSLTLFFHLIPGVTETFTRIPTGNPLFSSPEDPALQKVVGVLFVLFVAGSAWQVRRLRGDKRLGSPSVLPGAGRGLR